MALLLARQNLAARLRAWGLTVIEEPGWENRGASRGTDLRGVRAVMWHHTATPRGRFRNDPYPTEGILRHGRPGLSGPLCHIGFDRLGRVHLEGAGKANHAGKGSFGRIPKDAGNTYSLGIEMESSGIAPADWTPQQLEKAPILGAALSDIFDLDPIGDHCEHKQYSRSGKIDRFGWPGGINGFRKQVAAALKAGPRGKPAATAPVTAIAPWRTSKRVAGMGADDVRRIQQLVGVTADGIYGDRTGAAVSELQAELELPSDGVWGPTTEAAVSKLEDKIDRVLALAEQNRKDVDRIPLAVHTREFPLEGMHAGKTSTQQKKMAYEGHNHTQTHQLLAAVLVKLTEQEKLIELLASQRELNPETFDQLLRDVREAAATGAREGGVDVSAEDVAALLEVTVSKGD